MAIHMREQEIQKDIFREAIKKAKKTVPWERLTPSQKEKLITSCLRDRFETSRRQSK
jgi:hypothetical protein